MMMGRNGTSLFFCNHNPMSSATPTLMNKNLPQIFF